MCQHNRKRKKESSAGTNNQAIFSPLIPLAERGSVVWGLPCWALTRKACVQISPQPCSSLWSIRLRKGKQPHRAVVWTKEGDMCSEEREVISLPQSEMMWGGRKASKLELWGCTRGVNLALLPSTCSHQHISPHNVPISGVIGQCRYHGGSSLAPPSPVCATWAFGRKIGMQNVNIGGQPYH